MLRIHRVSPKSVALVTTLTFTLVLLSVRLQLLQRLTFLDTDPDFSAFDNRVGAPFPIVPNTVHFIKSGNNSFSFTDLICVRAAWLNQRPDSIQVHCDRCEHLKTGHYWSEISKIPGLQLVPEELPTHVFGRKLSSVYHAADVLRLQILSSVGGIFLDLDVFVVKNLNDYRRYEISIGVPPKQYLGTQVIVAHPRARFLKLWLDSYRFYRADKWYYNAGELPTTSILLKNPALVHIVPWDFGVHMLVVQIFGVCSSHWRDFHAIHLLSRHRHYLVNDTSAPKKFDEVNIKTYNKSFGEMARYALYGETHLILDDRNISRIEDVAKVDLSALPHWCDDHYATEGDWRSAKPMPNLE
ncbi:uncharacterized protein LOC100903370 [Galendromus occidentalis]|uniref:Uncharacterized protein LOC100903370 n=1 Tax=Galendromus occidentalis TaxID=34638 RepID=A0AAJ6VYH6_9ACAR|nr:uncharacterized protein LOC100903370 [Galendromus occidentalis]